MTTIATVATSPSVAERPPFKARISVARGNAIQLSGLTLGAAVMAAAAHLTDLPGVARTSLMLVGFSAIYLSCHALAHYAVGRLVGLQFRWYGLSGTDHPETYPPGIRRLMSHMPFLSSLSTKASRERVGRVGMALYFAAGETATAIFSIGAALYAAATGTPGGGMLFVNMIGFNIVSTVVTARTPRGDYAKAIRALRAGR